MFFSKPPPKITRPARAGGGWVAPPPPTAEALRTVAAATQTEGGMTAVNLQVAEKYVDAFGKLAKENNTLIVPGNLGDMSGMIASAMKIVEGAKKAG